MGKKVKRKKKANRRKPAASTVTRGGLLRKTVYYTEDEWKALQQASEDEGLSLAEVTRRAVQDYLGLERNPQKRGPDPDPNSKRSRSLKR